MSELLSYIIKLSIGLSVVYLFYQLVLRRLTFHTWNRWYLLLFTGLAFIWPLIDLSPLLQQHAWDNNPVVEMIPVVDGYTPGNVVDTMAVATNTWTRDNIVLLCLAAGIAVMLVRLLFQYWSLYRIRRHARLLVNNRVRIYQVNQPITPFSFGNAIYLNQQLHSEEELKDIVRHEFIHVKQKHSVDMIWGELLCILNWYNPFAWLTRHAIRQNLEFIADNQVLQTGIDRKQYQYLLLKVVGGSSFSIASNFNFSSLKKRIAMMNKTKSARVNLIRFLCMLPLVLVVLLGFRTMVPDPEPVQQAPAADTTPVKKAKRNLPDNVQSINIRNERVTVTLKNGKQEKYNLDNEEEREAFENKYGKMPEPPAPPVAPQPVTGVAPAARAPRAGAPGTEGVPGVPPAPEASPRPAQVPVPGATAVTAVPAAPAGVQSTPRPGAAPAAPAVPVPPVPPPAYKMPKGVKGFHIRNNKATVTLTNGKEETYDLNDPEQKAAFEKKFGKFEGYEEPVGVTAPAITTSSTVALTQDSHISTSVTVDDAPAKVSHTSNRTETVTERISGREVSRVEVVNSTQTAGDDEQDAATGDSRSGVLNLTPFLTADQLEQLKKDLNGKGFTLQIDDTQFRDGKLVAIRGMISHGKRKATFDAKNFRRVVIVFKRGAGFELNMLDQGSIVFNN